MATTICLTIADDGTMTVGAGQDMESMKQVPVKSLDAALDTIKQLAGAAAMPGEDMQPQAPEQETPEENANPADDEGEEAAMMGSYRPGSTGR